MRPTSRPACWPHGRAPPAAIGIVLLLAIRSADLHPAPRAPNTKGQVREAVRYIMGKPSLFWTLVIVGVVAIFGMPMPALLAGVADSVYGTGATGYGLYNSLAAVGALTGALASARRSSLRLRTIIFSALLYGLAMTLLGLGARLPKDLMLFVKNLVFLDGARTTTRRPSPTRS